MQIYIESFNIDTFILKIWLYLLNLQFLLIYSNAQTS